MTKKELFLDVLKNKRNRFVGWIRRIEDNENSIEYMTQLIYSDDSRVEHLIEVVESAYNDDLLAIKSHCKNNILTFGNFESIERFHNAICEYIESYL